MKNKHTETELISLGISLNGGVMNVFYYRVSNNSWLTFNVIGCHIIYILKIGYFSINSFWICDRVFLLSNRYKTHNVNIRIKFANTINSFGSKSVQKTETKEKDIEIKN